MKIKEIKEELLKSLTDIKRFEMFAETESHRSTDIKKVMKIINILDTVVDTIRLHLYRYKLVEIDDQHFMFLVYPNDYTDDGSSGITVKLFQSLVIDVYISYSDSEYFINPSNTTPNAICHANVTISTYTAKYVLGSNEDVPEPIDQIDIIIDQDPDYPDSDPDGGFVTSEGSWKFVSGDYEPYNKHMISEIKELYNVLDRIFHK